MPTADPHARLAGELRGPPPSQISELPDDDLDHLAGLIADARHRQAAEIAAAADRGLNFVPRLLRGPIRKALR